LVFSSPASRFQRLTPGGDLQSTARRRRQCRSLLRSGRVAAESRGSAG